MTDYVFAKSSGEILLIKGYTTEKCIINQAIKLTREYDCKINVYALSTHIINDTIDVVPCYYAEDDMVVSSDTGDVVFNKDTYHKDWYNVYANYDPFEYDDYSPAEKYDIDLGGDFDYD